MSNDLVPFAEQQKMAEAIVKSGFYGFKDISQVMAVMIVAQAENKHPGTVVQEYDIIQGRPALKSQAILARFQQSGGKVEYNTYTDDKVEMTFSHPAGGSLKLAWTLKQAAEIGLASKDNWRKYPRAMLKARVVSEGVRAVYPACILGHYAVEEVQDFEPRLTSPAQMREVVIPQIEITDELEPESDRALSEWAVYIPDGDGHKLYANCQDKGEFMAVYSELVDKIMSSTKLTPDKQHAKADALEQANIETLEKIRHGQ